MAQKAKKEQAKANTASLNSLHLGSLIVNAVFLLFFAVFRSRSLIAYVVLSIPAFLCEFMLEKSGRPRYNAETGALRSAGEDLAAAGLTEYMFDVVWLTWGTELLVLLLGNKLWFVLAVVPAFAAYKAKGLLGMTRQLAGMQGMASDTPGAGAGPAPNRRQRRAA